MPSKKSLKPPLSPPEVMLAASASVDSRDFDGLSEATCGTSIGNPWLPYDIYIIDTYINIHIYIYMSPVPGPPHPPPSLPMVSPPPLLTPPTPPKPSICMLFAHIHTHIHIYTPLSTPPTSHLYIICSTWEPRPRQRTLSTCIFLS